MTERTPDTTDPAQPNKTTPEVDPTVDPTGGDLPATEFPPDEFPDPKRQPGEGPDEVQVQVGPDEG